MLQRKLLWTCIFPRFPMIEAKAYKLIFYLTQANLIRFVYGTWKNSMNFVWNLQNLTAAAAILFCKNLVKFCIHVSQNKCNQFFMIIHSFQGKFHCYHWKAWYVAYICNKVTIGNLNNRSPFLYGKTQFSGKNTDVESWRVKINKPQLKT